MEIRGGSASASYVNQTEITSELNLQCNCFTLATSPLGYLSRHSHHAIFHVFLLFFESSFHPSLCNSTFFCTFSNCRLASLVIIFQVFISAVTVQFQLFLHMSNCQLAFSSQCQAKFLTSAKFLTCYCFSVISLLRIKN